MGVFIAACAACGAFCCTSGLSSGALFSMTLEATPTAPPSAPPTFAASHVSLHKVPRSVSGLARRNELVNVSIASSEASPRVSNITSLTNLRVAVHTSWRVPADKTSRRVMDAAGFATDATRSTPPALRPWKIPVITAVLSPAFTALDRASTSVAPCALWSA